MTDSKPVEVVDEANPWGRSKPMSDKLGPLQGEIVRVRVWWSLEAQSQHPDGDTFIAKLLDCVPLGRDYYFAFELEDGRRCLIKTAAVLSVEQVPQGEET